jgi:small-conductance mechanosensitive channel
MTAIGNTSKAVENLGNKIDRPVTGVIEWLQNNLDGLALGALVAAGIVAAMLVLRRIGQSILANNPDCNNWKGILGNILAKTSIVFMVAAAVEIVTIYAPVHAKLGQVIDVFFLVAAAFQGAVWARELVIGAVRSRVGEDPGETTLGNAMGIIRVLVSVAAFAIALIVILDNLGFNVTTLIAGLGIGGIAIGLAAQGIFADLFAGLAIVFDRPFRRGQQISWGARNADGSATNTGVVERIGLKTTRIRSRGGEQIIVSNTKLLEQELTNVDEAKVYRIWLPFGVTYQTEPDQLEQMGELLSELFVPLKGLRMVRCTVKGFGPSSVDFDLVYDDRARDFDARAKHRATICIGIMRLFEREKIDFAYPTQTTFSAAPDGTMVMPYAAVQPVMALEQADVASTRRPRK